MNEFPSDSPVPSGPLPISQPANQPQIQSGIESSPVASGTLPYSGDKLDRNNPALKVQAAFLLPSESFEAVYGGGEKDALADLVTFLNPVLGEASWIRPETDFSKIEALFTGWDSPKLDAALLKLFPALRIVFHAGGSVKFIATDEFWEKGIRITCTALANAVPVAEFTFAQIILGLKHAWRSARLVSDTRRFVRNDAAVPTCYGSVVGIISAGLIGRMVAKHLRQLDVRVICHDPFLSASDARALGVETCTLDEVFARADVVTCHTPLLPDTTHLLRERHFASMKPGATFINTARGAIVHEPEMIAVLSRRPDLFAALDVTDPEPPAENSPLFSLPNVFLTPHIAGSIGPECHRMGQMIVDEVRRYLANQPLLGEVLREQLPLLA